MTSKNTEATPVSQSPRTVKCVVWDLDNTLWKGILLEDNEVELRAEIPEILQTLDERGILLSIASKNEYESARQRLEAWGLWHYFLVPQINWNSKVSSLREIASLLNLSLDTFAFIDDQVFEREEVAYALPDVLCIDSSSLDLLLSMPALSPAVITEDARHRRQMYLSDMQRKQAEQEFTGPNEDFLATLKMRVSIDAACEKDLQRAEELTVRTHQLNTTGYTYSYEELCAFLTSDRHQLLIASLEDRYGSYGKIGLALLQCDPGIWTIKLFLMSCRVISRGVGTVMINYLMHMAREAHVRLRAEFIPNGRNRMMLVTYKFAGFREVEKRGSMLLLESDCSHIQAFPPYMEITPPIGTTSH